MLVDAGLSTGADDSPPGEPPGVCFDVNEFREQLEALKIPVAAISRPSDPIGTLGGPEDDVTDDGSYIGGEHGRPDGAPNQALLESYADRPVTAYELHCLTGHSRSIRTCLLYTSDAAEICSV